MSGHVVVAVEACPQTDEPSGGFCARMAQAGRDESCLGCLGDGTRAVLDSAVPVERTEVIGAHDSMGWARKHVWREVAP